MTAKSRFILSFSITIVSAAIAVIITGESSDGLVVDGVNVISTPIFFGILF